MCDERQALADEKHFRQHDILLVEPSSEFRSRRGSGAAFARSPFNVSGCRRFGPFGSRGAGGRRGPPAGAARSPLQRRSATARTKDTLS